MQPSRQYPRIVPKPVGVPEREEAGAKVIVHLMTPPATIPVCGARTPSTTEIDHGASFMFTNSPRFVTCPDCRNATMTRQETADELTHEAEALGLYDEDRVTYIRIGFWCEAWSTTYGDDSIFPVNDPDEEHTFGKCIYGDDSPHEWVYRAHDEEAPRG